MRFSVMLRCRCFQGRNEKSHENLDHAILLRNRNSTRKNNSSYKTVMLRPHPKSSQPVINIHATGCYPEPGKSISHLWSVFIHGNFNITFSFTLLTQESLSLMPSTNVSYAFFCTAYPCLSPTSQPLLSHKKNYICKHNFLHPHASNVMQKYTQRTHISCNKRLLITQI